MSQRGAKGGLWFTNVLPSRDPAFKHICLLVNLRIVVIQQIYFMTKDCGDTADILYDEGWMTIIAHQSVQEKFTRYPIINVRSLYWMLGRVRDPRDKNWVQALLYGQTFFYFDALFTISAWKVNRCLDFSNRSYFWQPSQPLPSYKSIRAYH